LNTVGTFAKETDWASMALKWDTVGNLRGPTREGVGGGGLINAKIIS